MAGRRSRRRIRAWCYRVFAILPPLAGAVYIMLPYWCVMKEVTIGSGEGCPNAQGFLRWKNRNASLISEINEDTVFDQLGDYDVTVRVYGRDMASVLHVRDTAPPVIRGVRGLTMTEGESISYRKGVTVTDDYDRNVALNVDASAVDTSKAGYYTVIYTAVDSSGNKASVSTTLHVKPVVPDMTPEEVVIAEADKLLAVILTNSMSQYEKAEAIYDWCHDTIAYTDDASKTDWVQGAYQGLVDQKGDCYVYAATARCLLTRAGIRNMDIEKIPDGSMHYWNLIDIGEGWHHFDTCKRMDGSTFFYMTDAELMEYSNANGKTHNYDRNLYPEIK